MTTTITAKGLEEIISRMQAYPAQLSASAKVAMDATLLVLWENVPPYPSQKGANPTYERTGTLGRSLGSSEGGGKAGGEPDIFEVKALGSAGGYEGRFGTNLEYAEYVIGDETQAAHMGYWWQMKDISARAQAKIDRIWGMLGEKMKSFLESK